MLLGGVQHSGTPAQRGLYEEGNICPPSFCFGVSQCPQAVTEQRRWPLGTAAGSGRQLWPGLSREAQRPEMCLPFLGTPFFPPSWCWGRRGACHWHSAGSRGHEEAWQCLSTKPACLHAQTGRQAEMRQESKRKLPGLSWQLFTQCIKCTHLFFFKAYESQPAARCLDQVHCVKPPQFLRNGTISWALLGGADWHHQGLQSLGLFCGRGSSWADSPCHHPNCQASPLPSWEHLWDKEVAWCPVLFYKADLFSVLCGLLACRDVPLYTQHFPCHLQLDPVGQPLKALNVKTNKCTGQKECRVLL